VEIVTHVRRHRERSEAIQGNTPSACALALDRFVPRIKSGVLAMTA
jgi:hypothetical protein